MREVTVAAIQMRCSRNVKENIEKESDLITKAAEMVHKSYFHPNFSNDSIFVRREDMNIMNTQSHLKKMMLYKA